MTTISQPLREPVKARWGLLWSSVALVVAIQAFALSRLGFGRGGPGAWPSSYGLIALWGLASPFVVRSADRWPVEGSSGRRHLGFHLVAAIGFVGLTNLVIRLPNWWLEPGVGLARLVRATVGGIVAWGPYAMVVYGTLVLFGHFARARRIGRVAELVLPSGADEANARSVIAPVDPPAPPSASAPPATLVVREATGKRVIAIAAIQWVSADDNYVKIGAGGEVHRVRMRIAAIERALGFDRFIRIHRSAIVAVAQVRAVIPRVHGDWTVELHSGHEFPVARGRRKALEGAIAARAVPRPSAA